MKMKQRVFRLALLIMVLALLVSVAGMAEGGPDDLLMMGESMDASKGHSELEIDDGFDFEGLPELPDADLLESGEIVLGDARETQTGSGLDAMLDDEALARVNANVYGNVVRLGVMQKHMLDTSDVAGRSLGLGYKSTDGDIAGVSREGVITGRGEGTAYIIVFSGDEELIRYQVDVFPAPSKVSFDSKTVTVCADDMIRLTPVIPEGTCASFTWSSADKGVAAVAADGTVTGVKQGRTTVTVKTHNGRRASISVEVSRSKREPLSDEAFSKALVAMIDRYDGNGIASNGESGGDEFASARLIVKIKKGELPDLSGYNALDMIRDGDNHYLIQFASPEDAENCCGYLEGVSNVKYVQPDRYVTLDDMSDELVANAYSWGVSAIGADAYAADLNRRKKTTRVVVAVVDTGINLSHPLFKGRLVPGRDIADADDTPRDTNGHGTHVAGTIVDCTPGLNVKIMPVRVFRGRQTSTSLICNGLRWATRKKPDVINMSFGSGDAEHRGEDMREPYQEELINKAVKKGITVVAAAGNERQDTRTISPAAMKNIIVVSAMDESGRFVREFSNYGKSVDVAAPGVDITSAWIGRNQYNTISGTSMATPHASAAAAMVLCDDPNLSPADVERKLKAAATDRGAKGWDEYYGWGLLNLRPLIRSYIVKYKPNGGTGAPSSQTKIKGQTLILSSEVPEKAYKVTFDYGTGERTVKKVLAGFNGWNTKANGKGRAYSAGGRYTKNEDVTLYAQWKSARLGELPAPTRPGYLFEGWFTEADGGDAVTAKTKVLNNMTVYAHWVEDETAD